MGKKILKFLKCIFTVKNVKVFLGLLISAGIIGNIFLYMGTQDTNQTNKEIADQQHQDKQEEIQLKNVEACSDEMNDYYSNYINTHEHLIDDINYMQDMYSKWLENNHTLPTEAEEKLKNIFGRLYFILKTDEGDNLKHNMEIWLKVLVPSIKSDEEEYKKIKEQMTQETTENSGNIETPLTPPLPDLTDAMEAYDKSFKEFIKDEVQNCANRKKENK